MTIDHLCDSFERIARQVPSLILKKHRSLELMSIFYFVDRMCLLAGSNVSNTAWTASQDTKSDVNDTMNDIISLLWNDIVTIRGLNFPIKYLLINGLGQSGCTLYLRYFLRQARIPQELEKNRRHKNGIHVYRQGWTFCHLHLSKKNVKKTYIYSTTRSAGNILLGILLFIFYLLF